MARWPLHRSARDRRCAPGRSVALAGIDKAKLRLLSFSDLFYGALSERLSLRAATLTNANQMSVRYSYVGGCLEPGEFRLQCLDSSFSLGGGRRPPGDFLVITQAGRCARSRRDPRSPELCRHSTAQPEIVSVGVV
jgi:hypothetical protein